MSEQEIQQLRNEAADRRDAIARDVELVTDRVAPGRIAERQKAKFGQSVGNARNRVFGSPEPSQTRFTEALSDSSDSSSSESPSLSEKASGALENVKETTPDSVGEFTEGNPLAAGLIGLGVGLLAATLIPSTREEQQIADKTQDRIDSAATEIARSGQSAAENIQPAVTESATSVKESAVASADSVKGDAKSAADEVKDTAKSVKD